jgi:hypothetical protein
MENPVIRNPFVVPANVYVLLRVPKILGSVKVTAYIDLWIRSREGQLDLLRRAVIWSLHELASSPPEAKFCPVFIDFSFSTISLPDH